MTFLLRFMCALAIAAWFGAMFFFSGGVAPVAFQVLPTHTLAGNFVDGSIRWLYQLSYVAGTLLLLGLVGRIWLEPGRRRVLRLELVIALVMLGLSLYAGLGVTPPMAQIRAQVPTLDALTPQDATRARFDQLHQLSVVLMSLDLLGAIALIALEQLPGRRDV